MIDLHKRVALITGATGGIGGAAARLLAQAGATVVIAGRNEDQLRQVNAALAVHGFVAPSLCFDVTDGAAVREAFVQVKRQAGRLDILVNAAGIMHLAPLAMLRREDLDRQLGANVAGTLLCCQYASRLMARNGGGSIINLSSIVSDRGAPGQSAYAASKAAINGVTRALARELGPQGIRVNAVAPGFIETALTASFDQAQKDRLRDTTALVRLGTPEDVAGVILFLASHLADYVTGQIIGVDGAMTL